MPSPRHDAVNQLFRDRPELAVEILRELAGLKMPADAPVQLESNDFNDRPSKDFQPDTVITVGPAQAPVQGIVVEVQHEKTEGKRRQLPRYAAALWLMLRCPVTVLCVCPDVDVAAWYAEPIRTDLTRFELPAVVLGPREVPVLMRPEEVAVRPELAAMGVMVHGRDRRVVEAFMAGLDLIKSDDAPQYYEYAYSMAASAARRLMEEIMASTTWPVYSPFAREHFGRGKREGREEGLEEGRAEGLVEGRVEGLVEGRVEGRVEGEASAVLRVLAARGIQVPDDVRARICACTDTRQLDTWLDRAVDATAVSDLFE